MAVTGGGSGALAALLQVPGASATVLEAVVPYAAEALAQWLGAPPDQACGESTARQMAMAAFERARRLTDADPRTLRGIGATASLATTRPKRGPHRIHVAWQSAEETVVTSCELAKGARSRAEEEQIATQLVLDAVAETCGVEANGDAREAFNRDAEVEDRSGRAERDPNREPLHRREKRAPAEWTELLLGERQFLFAGEKISNVDAKLTKGSVLFPGAFHPPHPGHERMAAIAAARYGKPALWELSIINVDKPPLDFLEIHDRLAGLADHPVLLTHAPTFVEKAALAPGCTFVVGADTIERIAEPRYYAGETTRRDAAVNAIAATGCRFLVFGRLIGERFCTLNDLDLPPALATLCEEIPATEFRQDVASSVIRAQLAS